MSTEPTPPLGADDTARDGTHPLLVALAWLRREYRETNPRVSESEVVTWKARPLLAALTTFIAAEKIDAAPQPPTAGAGDRWRSQAVDDVLAERRRQVEVKGFHLSHDDVMEGDGRLARAAGCYAHNAGCPPILRDQRRAYASPIWPWSPDTWRPSTPRRDLVKAGALILAEIERLDRQQGPNLHGEALTRRLADVSAQCRAKGIAPPLPRERRQVEEPRDEGQQP